MALAGHDVEWLFGEIAHAARRGKPLAEALAELARAEEGARRGRAAQRLAQRLTEGKSLSAAVAAEERNYPPGSAAAIEAGEKSGRLPEALTAMAEGVELETGLRHRVVLAMVYPVVVATGCIVLMVLMKLTFFAWFDGMLSDFNVERPFMTLAMPTIAVTVAVVGVILPACMLALLFFARVPGRLGQGVIDHVRIRCPFFRRSTRHVLLSRWCATVGPLFAAGVAEPRAVLIAGGSAGNLSVQQACSRMAARMEQGMSLAEAMAKEDFFPPVLCWVVAARTQVSGHSDVWPIVRSIYLDHARTETSTMAFVLGVWFLFITITLVGLSTMAVFLPLFTISNSLGG